MPSTIPEHVRHLPQEKISYHVLNENTLGYFDPRRPHQFGVLHGSVIKGGHNWKNGPAPLGRLDTLRPATLKDFDDYRVCPKGHIA